MSRVQVVETNLQANGEMSPLDPSQVKYYIIHHTTDTRDMSAEEINQEHINANGWSMIGYHFLIHSTGVIERGRPRAYRGAHCEGSNYCSIGIALSGNFCESSPTEDQIASLVGLCADLNDIYGLTASEAIKGHKDFLATDCPGDNLYPNLGDIASKVASA